MKASTLMDLELADYQRSMQSLEGELASREGQLQEARRASQIQLESTQQLRKELGERTHYLEWQHYQSMFPLLWIYKHHQTV